MSQVTLKKFRNYSVKWRYFFLKEQIRNKDKIIAMTYYYEIDGQLEKMK